MLITKKIHIHMGHRVPNHKSQCRNPHGHTYFIEVGVDDKVISNPGESDDGMVIDFSDLKDIMMAKIDKNFDHAFVVYKGDKYMNFFDEMYKDGLKIVTVDVIPTAENLAKIWFEMLEQPLKVNGIKLHHVKVWETPSSTATYSI